MKKLAMKKYVYSLLISVASLLFVVKANALLVEGVVAPDFTIQAAQGGEVVSYTLYEALKKGPVVIFFYPKAFSSGCTVQAHMFAQAKDQFSALGASILGLSNDTIEVAKDFSVKECSSAFPVGADPDGKVVKAYDASLLFGSETSKRVTYVITPDGKIFHTYSDMSPKEHVTESLNAVKRWKEKQQPAN